MLSGLLKRFVGSTSVPAIEHEELVRAHRDQSCLVVDVREPHEFRSGHIPGAQNLPLSQFDPGAMAKGRPVVLICQAGGRSATALRRALAAGRQDVRHYAGGMSRWRARGGAVA
ncbi:rhodanese-like domain-containing protein [Bradyrhizobium sp.]|uniref:rhodanese-like domain-containing protein n=1 Tax=Bradyrhizobium sp. TaxID=376 RepID=UPI00238F8E3B|nr:rhodanese-like domain-containing protein [Bradyrhizobium sp.]MDE2377209.1 rhodanese-like domain-containing protein [Bradyrhizobium sp.]